MNNDENRENLDGIMYDSEGNFIPITASHGNMDGSLAHLRNTYMESEKLYFEQLLTDPAISREFRRLINERSDDLFECAMEIQKRLEYGELETQEEKVRMQTMTPEERDAYHMQKLSKAEGLMCLLYAAAKDRVKTLNKELILEKFDISRGRSR